MVFTFKSLLVDSWNSWTSVKNWSWFLELFFKICDSRIPYHTDRVLIVTKTKVKTCWNGRGRRPKKSYTFDQFKIQIYRGFSARFDCSFFKLHVPFRISIKYAWLYGLWQRPFRLDFRGNGRCRKLGKNVLPRGKRGGPR